MERERKILKLATNFVPFDIIPKDIFVLVIQNLNPVEVAKCRQVCKRWCEVLSRGIHSVWFWNASYDEFLNHVQGARTRQYWKMLRTYLSNGVWNVGMAWDIVDWWRADIEKRKVIFMKHCGFNIEERRKLKRSVHFCLNAFLRSDIMFVALYEGLITIDEILRLGTVYGRCLLCSIHGLDALREKLISVEQASSMPSSNHLYDLFFGQNRGLTALREGLITVEELQAMPHRWFIFFLFRHGFQAFQEKLITAVEVSKMPLRLTTPQLWDIIFIALRENKITIAEISAIPDNKTLRDYLEKLT